MVEKLLEFLDHVNPLSPALRERLVRTIQYKFIEKKNYFLKERQVSDKIAFLESGLFRCFYYIHDTDISSWFMKENDVVISVKSFFKQVPSLECIQALEDSEIYFIKYGELQQIYQDFPEFILTGKLVTEHYYVLSEERSFVMRSQKAHERYRYLMENCPEIVRRVPSKYIASYLGISEVTLSTIKSRRLVY